MDGGTRTPRPGGRWLHEGWLWFPLALILALAVSYHPAWDAPFYFDDFSNFVEIPRARMDARSFIQRTGEIFSMSWIGDRSAGIYTFALNRWILGDSPFAFRSVNLAIHFFAALALYGLLRRLCRKGTPGEPEDSAFLAVLPASAAMLWAIHPVQTQTVTYIVQRLNGGMGLLFLASCLFFWLAVEGGRRRVPLIVLSAISGLLSIGFKQNGLLLPLAFLLLLAAFAPIRKALARRGKWTVPAAAGLAALWLSLILAYAARARAEESLGLPYGDRLLTQARILVHYVTLFLFPYPSRLHLNYDFPVSSGLFSPPATALAVALVAAWAGGIVWLWRRDRWIAFGMAWYLLLILPESALPTIDLVFEHRLYLPSAGLSILAVRLGYLAATRLGLPQSKHGKPLMTIVGCLAIGLLLASTFARNRVWADPLRFWEHEVRAAPGNIFATKGFVVDLMKAGRTREAIAVAEEALQRELRPVDAAQLWTNLSLAYASEGDWERMIRMLENPRIRRPELIQEAYNLGVAYYMTGRLPEAEARFHQVLAADPDHPDSLFYRGKIEDRKENYGGAAEYYRRALRYRPRDPGILLGLEAAYYRSGKIDLAAEVSERVAESGGVPEDADRMFRLGHYHLRKRELERAEREFSRFLSLFPDHKEAHYNMACVLSLRGDIAGSVHHFDRALALGFRDDILFRDPDLRSLRDSPKFAELIERHGLSGGGSRRRGKTALGRVPEPGTGNPAR